MIITNATPIAIQLRHPLNNCPSMATIVGNWVLKGGEQVGYVLRFACGHQAALKFEEIRELQG